MSQRSELGIQVGLPDVREQPLLGGRNLANVALTLWVPVPAIVCAFVLFSPSGLPPL